MRSDNTHGIGHDDFIYPSAVPFVLVHAGCVAAIWSGITWKTAGLCVVLYWLRLFAITAGYHRYFSHRAYSTSRLFQFILAFLAQTSAQKSILWWAAKHRHHHLHSDTPDDVHSPRRKGFVYSHIGWVFAREHAALEWQKVSDLACYPELVWLHRLELAPAAILGAFCFLVAGWAGFVVGFLWSTVLVYHATFCINSLAHVSGKKRYVTGDDSRNNWVLALITMGEGWHNNHHAYQSSARQGFKWWEIDLTYYILKALSRVRVVWDLKTPPQRVLDNEQRLGSRIVDRAAQQLAERFNSEEIALIIASACQGAEITALWTALSGTHGRAGASIDFYSAYLPRREELLMEATLIFARTKSLDEIANRGYEMLLDAVGKHLAPFVETHHSNFRSLTEFMATPVR